MPSKVIQTALYQPAFLSNSIATKFFCKRPHARPFPTHSHGPINLKMSIRQSTLVEPSWLSSRLGSVSILDASWYMPSANRDPKADFTAQRIQGARFFDLDGPLLCDSNSSLPHMLPSSPSFSDAVTNLAVTNDKPVVLYSQNGFVAAARAWWMFRLFGKSDVYILNGGLHSWKQASFLTETGPLQEVAVPTKKFIAKEQPELVRNMSDMLKQIESGEGLIIDARSQARFNATVPEPRAGLMGGHMPGAFCLPSSACATDGRLKTIEELQHVFSEHGLTPNVLKRTPISLTCGSGITAAIVCLALYELGIQSAVYDGSWSEYGSYHDNPVHPIRSQ